MIQVMIVLLRNELRIHNTNYNYQQEKQKCGNKIVFDYIEF